MPTILRIMIVAVMAEAAWTLKGSTEKAESGMLVTENPKPNIVAPIMGMI